MELLNINNNALLFKSKEETKDIAFYIFDQVEQGIEDPIKTLAIIHKIGQICKEVETNIRPLVQVQLGKEKLERFGIKLSEVKTGSTFDYLGTGDQEYQKLLNDLEKAKTAVKNRETFLKSLDRQVEVVNTDTGETYTISPPLNTFSQTLKIEF